MEVGGHVPVHFDLFAISFLSILDRTSSLKCEISGFRGTFAGISPGTVNCWIGWMVKNHALKHPKHQGVSDEGLIFETSEDVEVLPTFDALLGVEVVGWWVGGWVEYEGAIIQLARGVECYE